jgi:pSer/pThr/pTyr-binding forkhead associated (FHA) protein
MIPTVTLRVIEGPHEGQELVCTDLTHITIGRSDECNFRLHGEPADLLVSRRHCLIEARPEWVEVRDLESRNGTFVNGLRVGFPIDPGSPDGSAAFRRRLRNGDLLYLGTSVVQVTVQVSAIEATPPAEAEAVQASAAGV